MKRAVTFLQENKRYVIFSLVFFLVSLALISLFPLTGDDLMWGSPMGEELLDSWFEGYNGRYSSNLLIMAMTRSIVLRNLLIASLLLFLMLVPSLLLKKKSISLMAFSSLCLLLIPKSVFVQGFVWSSGFAVYVPATVIMLAYFVIERDAFDGVAPKHSAQRTIICSLAYGVLGFVGAMFVETAAICNLCVSIAFPIFVFLKHKRVYPSHLIFCASNIVGTIFTFSNVDNVDGYRVFPTADTYMDTVIRRIPEIINPLFAEGIFVFAAISLLCVIIAVPKLKARDGSIGSILSVALVVNAFTLVLMFLRKDNYVWYLFWHNVNASSILLGILALMYAVSVVVIIKCCVTDKALVFKMLACLISAFILIAPMLLVDPYGPRCLFPTCVCIVILASLLFYWVITTSKVLSSYTRVISIGIIATLFAVFFFLFSIYSTINHYANKREEYILKQIEQGYTTIIVPYLPYGSYTWCSDISIPYWGDTYKSFHGLDSHITFKAIDSDYFDAWMQEFDKITEGRK